MKKMEQLYEGKAKKVFATEDPDVVIVDYKDDATAFNGEKKGTIVGKGAINNRMTNHVFKLLEKEGVPTHLIEELSDRETAVKKVQIVPLEVIIRNVENFMQNVTQLLLLRNQQKVQPYMLRWNLAAIMVRLRRVQKQLSNRR